MRVHPSELRAADSDREAVADILRAQCAAGRLDVSELEERLSAALDARTLGELDRLLADFPEEPAPGRVAPRTEAARAGGAPHKVGLPGLARFHYVDVFDSDRATMFAEALEHIVPPMVRGGYDVVSRDEPRMIVFEIRERPGWVPWVCVLAFPVGLLALAYKETQRIVVTFDEIALDRTRVTVAGLARRPVRRAFAEFGD